MKLLTSHKQTVLLAVILCILCAFVFFMFLPWLSSHHYISLHSQVAAPVTQAEAIASVRTPSYVATPVPLKAIYMTSWVAGTPSIRSGLVKLIDETEINSVVIDIKDHSGTIVFPVSNPTLKAHGSEEVRVRDLAEFIESLHQKGVYVIGRVAVFQDEYFVKHRPDLAVKNKAGTAIWKDRKGISWIDAGAREYWDYTLLIARESRRIGFDEINFDYIRFPSDGNMKDISFPYSSTTPKSVVLKDFFSYIKTHLNEPGLKTSADLFGMVTTAQDDMGIGQVLEDALPYFDYISPMVYPSHYPPTFSGFKEPEAHPYEVIQFAMQAAVTRAIALASTTASLKLRSASTEQLMIEYKNKLRPWLQDFGLRMTYGSAEVRAQIKATYDVGLDSWMLWSASNKYTRGALNTE